MPSSSSWNVSCFQTVLTLPRQVSLSIPPACSETVRISSSRQLNRTMQPVNEVSKVAARSGLVWRSRSGSSFDRTRAWIRDREALITAASDEMATMCLGASWYLEVRSYMAFPVVRHCVVTPAWKSSVSLCHRATDVCKCAAWRYRILVMEIAGGCGFCVNSLSPEHVWIDGTLTIVVASVKGSISTTYGGVIQRMCPCFELLDRNTSNPGLRAALYPSYRGVGT